MAAQTKRLRFSIALLVTLCMACSANNPVGPELIEEAAHFVIHRVEKGTGIYDHPHLRIVVTNKGNGTGSNVGCIGSLFNEDGGTILRFNIMLWERPVSPGGGFYCDVVLVGLESHEEYSRSEIILMWPST